MFNTLKFMKDLEATGMTREQAETFTENLSDMVFANLATKQDLNQFDFKINEKIDRVEERLNNKIDQAVNKLTIKLGSLLAIGLGVMSFVVKFSN